MRQRYDNIKRLMPLDIQPGNLKIYEFCQKILQMALGPGESAAGVA